MAKPKIQWQCDGFAPFLDKVQSHHVFNFCLDYVKRADTTVISSFAINEAFVRRLIKNRDKLGHLTVIWDTTMATRNIKTLLFLARNVDAVHLVANHSKMIWMQGQNECVAVSSVNTTGNYRNEGGLITNHQVLVNFYQEHLNKIIEDSLQWMIPSPI